MSNIKSINTPSTFIQAIHGDNFFGEVQVSVLEKNIHRNFGNNDLSALSETIEELNANDSTFISVATHGGKLKQGKKVSGETAEQVSGFFADLDIETEKSNGKRYPKDEATVLAILAEFDWQPSVIVRTGGGLHAHFKLEKPVICTDRQSRARMAAVSRGFQKRLRTHFKKHGFEIDSVGDLARICRAPGTLNHKYDPPRPVEVIAYNPDALVSDEMIANLAKDAPVSTSRRGTRREYPPSDHGRIAQNCEWYALQSGDGAATSDEPNWFAAASITARCVNGKNEFLAYSRKHSDFSEREALAKFEHARDSAGPRSCESIRNELGNDRICDACPHQGQVKSPVQLGFKYRQGILGPIPMGCTRDGSYVLRDQGQNTIQVMSANQLLSYQRQLGLAPSDFWRKQFPSDKGAYNTIAAGEALIEECKRLGPFDPDTIRGRGFWLEDERLIANLDGKIPEGTRHTYICFDPLPVRSGSTFDTIKLRALLERLPWKNPQDALLMMGWLALAVVCGALGWRPHAFVYGPANSGKTTLHNLAVQLLSPLVVSADGQSTEAGVRQRLGPDALPVVMDDFETDHSPARLQTMMRLARSASSAESPLLRGTPEGKALVFNVRTMFLFSAINVAGMGPQDATRVLVFELGQHESDSATAAAIVAETKELTGATQNWVGYVASHAEIIIQGIDVFKEALGAMESRHKQNMASLLSGAFVTLEGRLPTATEALAWVSNFSATLTRHEQAHERDNSSEALTHLFDHHVDGGQTGRYPLGHWVGTALNELNKPELRNDFSDSQRIVASHGMRFEIDDGKPVGLLLQNGSPTVDRIFANTPWANRAWQRALRQSPGAYSPPNPVRFKGTSGKHRATGLPLSVIPKPIDDVDDVTSF